MKTNIVTRFINWLLSFIKTIVNNRRLKSTKGLPDNYARETFVAASSLIDNIEVNDSFAVNGHLFYLWYQKGYNVRLLKGQKSDGCNFCLLWLVGHGFYDASTNDYVIYKHKTGAEIDWPLFGLRYTVQTYFNPIADEEYMLSEGAYSDFWKHYQTLVDKRLAKTKKRKTQ